MRRRRPGNRTSEYISTMDCEETKDNCPSCTLLWTISAPYRHPIVPHETAAEIRAVKFWLTHEHWLCMSIYDPEKPPLDLEVFTTTGMSNIYCLVKQRVLDADWFLKSGHTCPFPAIKPMPMISEHTGSDQAMALISRWIQECVHGHQHCNHIQLLTLLPKRLVEILGPEKVILRTFNTDTVGSYATLSHCWGTKRFIKNNKVVTAPEPTRDLLDRFTQDIQRCCGYHKTSRNALHMD